MSVSRAGVRRPCACLSAVCVSAGRAARSQAGARADGPLSSVAGRGAAAAAAAGGDADAGGGGACAAGGAAAPAGRRAGQARGRRQGPGPLRAAARARAGQGGGRAAPAPASCPACGPAPTAVLGARPSGLRTVGPVQPCWVASGWSLGSGRVGVGPGEGQEPRRTNRILSRLFMKVT